MGVTQAANDNPN
jgi:hypothetical protein